MITDLFSSSVRGGPAMIPATQVASGNGSFAAFLEASAGDEPDSADASTRGDDSDPAESADPAAEGAGQAEPQQEADGVPIKAEPASGERRSAAPPAKTIDSPQAPLSQPIVSDADVRSSEKQLSSEATMGSARWQGAQDHPRVQAERPEFRTQTSGRNGYETVETNERLQQKLMPHYRGHSGDVPALPPRPEVVPDRADGSSAGGAGPETAMLPEDRLSPPIAVAAVSDPGEGNDRNPVMKSGQVLRDVLPVTTTSVPANITRHPNDSIATPTPEAGGPLHENGVGRSASGKSLADGALLPTLPAATARQNPGRNAPTAPVPQKPSHAVGTTAPAATPLTSNASGPLHIARQATPASARHNLEPYASDTPVPPKPAQAVATFAPAVSLVTRTASESLPPARQATPATARHDIEPSAPTTSFPQKPEHIVATKTPAVALLPGDVPQKLPDASRRNGVHATRWVEKPLPEPVRWAPLPGAGQVAPSTMTHSLTVAVPVVDKALALDAPVRQPDREALRSLHQAAEVTPTLGHASFHLGRSVERGTPALRPAVELARSTAQQIGAQVLNLGKGRFELSLAPAELGKVEMMLQDNDNRLTLIVNAERPETMDLIRRHISMLEQELREMGLGNLSLQLGSNGSHASQGGQGRERPLTSGTDIDTPPDPARLSALSQVPGDHLDLRL